MDNEQKSEYDFSGWATKNNLLCSDGRVILPDAFKHNDNKVVPLVWNHEHSTPNEVLGQALLKHQADGVYMYGTFNDTESGKTARLLVEHGDIDQLSIYANRLQETGKRVSHGDIREVSLVLAGANPGAFIDSVIKHGEICDGEAYISTGEYIIKHGDEPDFVNEEPDIDPVEQTVVEEPPITTVSEPVVESVSEPVIEHVDKTTTEPAAGEETIADVIATMNDKQQNVLYGLIADTMANNNNNEEDGNNMKHNAFDATTDDNTKVLSHSDITAILGDAKRLGSLKTSYLEHTATYGMDGIDFLFPDAKNYTTEPQFITNDMTWVQKVMSGVHHTPMSRIRTLFADITEDAARAKGYIKGKLKKEEVFSLLKRVTTPQTIYKKQKLDRDDVIDITDFDVVAWLRGEMRIKLDEEIAQAILIGDNRLSSDDDKINETNVRPISKDEILFTIQTEVTVAALATDDDVAREFIRSAIKSRKEYKGSGNPSLFTTEDMITDCLLLEDKMGRVLYESVDKLAIAMRVKEVIAVAPMETAKGKNDKPLLGVIVNLADYNVGADKGGSINMFEDFDIDYNQQKYLIETRCSGALVKPYSAIALTLNRPSAG